VSPQQNPFGWADIHRNLGWTLRLLGEREPSTTTLNAEIAAYQEALTEFRKIDPPTWAAIQTNLGRALLRRGEREDNADDLVRAVASFAAALTERTRERLPFAWAETQKYLGDVLLMRGQRERGTGTATLHRAVDAYQEVIEQLGRTRGHAPVWASAQYQLGLALTAIGQRTGDTRAFRDAVCAFDAALIVFTRESAPLDWAAAQKNLDLALGVVPEQRCGDLGMTLAPLTTDVRKQFSIDSGIVGLVITSVETGSPAEEKHLEPGDVISEIHHKQVVEPRDVRASVREAAIEGKHSVLLLISKKGKETDMRFVAVKLR
jgi:hypothetical protein